MNQMRVSKAAAAPGGKEKPADRLKRLMAAQFNGNVAADTKKQLERRQEQEREQKARAAVERHALAVPRGRAGNVSRRHDHGGDELEYGLLKLDVFLWSANAADVAIGVSGAVSCPSLGPLCKGSTVKTERTVRCCTPCYGATSERKGIQGG